jgi:hypothetical protein
MLHNIAAIAAASSTACGRHDADGERYALLVQGGIAKKRSPQEQLWRR